ncbi:MAG TPA: hypothetical protein VGI24_12620 [Solirubrobacteraceae bacterium]|jgi:hypothetical protein
MSKIRKHHALLLPATLVLLMLFAGTAEANVGEEIIRRCTHAESLSGFSQAAYRQALKELSAGTEEYSNCAQEIRQAQLAAAGAGRGGGSGGGSPTTTTGSAAPTPSEQRSIAHASSAGAVPLQVGAQTIHPGVVHADIASAFSALPTPLLATVVFLIVCLLAAAGAGIRNRIRDVRRPR